MKAHMLPSCPLFTRVYKRPQYHYPLISVGDNATALLSASSSVLYMSSQEDMGQYFSSARRSCAARTRDSTNQNFTAFTRVSRWKVLTHYLQVMRKCLITLRSQVIEMYVQAHARMTCDSANSLISLCFLLLLNITGENIVLIHIT